MEPGAVDVNGGVVRFKLAVAYFIRDAVRFKHGAVRFTRDVVGFGVGARTVESGASGVAGGAGAIGARAAAFEVTACREQTGAPRFEAAHGVVEDGAVALPWRRRARERRAVAREGLAGTPERGVAPREAEAWRLE